MRHSIAWPVNVTSLCLNDSRSPAAIRICSLTMSMPVTNSVTGCSTWTRVFTSMKIEVALVVQQELEGPGVGVLHGAGGLDDGAAQLAAQLLGDRDRRRLLDQLLVPPLDRALALAEMDDVAVMVAEHLELDVARRARRTSRCRRRRRRRPPRPRAARSSSACDSSPAARTTRMPRPPPPAAALMITG